jgi:HAMP domain-containing protein
MEVEGLEAALTGVCSLMLESWILPPIQNLEAMEGV